MHCAVTSTGPCPVSKIQLCEQRWPLVPATPSGKRLALAPWPHPARGTAPSTASEAQDPRGWFRASSSSPGVRAALPHSRLPVAAESARLLSFLLQHFAHFPARLCPPVTAARSRLAGRGALARVPQSPFPLSARFSVSLPRRCWVLLVPAVTVPASMQGRVPGPAARPVTLALGEGAASWVSVLPPCRRRWLAVTRSTGSQPFASVQNTQPQGPWRTLQGHIWPPRRGGRHMCQPGLFLGLLEQGAPNSAAGSNKRVLPSPAARLRPVLPAPPAAAAPELLGLRGHRSGLCSPQRTASCPLAAPSPGPVRAW